MSKPLEYTAGTSFDYSVWTADTRLSMVRVPWDNMYRDVVRFKGGKAELDSWIDSQETPEGRISKTTRARLNRPVRVDIPYSVAATYNYIRARNPVQPIGGRVPDVATDFYYFILEAREVNPSTTELIVQLDVWQTYVYGMEFGTCYLERGHAAIANENQFRNFGRDYLTVPEGLDTGGEYKTVAYRRRSTMWNVGNGYNILACSTIDLEAEPGTKVDPNQETAPGGFFQNVPSGATFYVWENVEQFRNFMRKYSNKPWVTQGIISITLIPELTRYIPGFSWNNRSPDYYGLEAPSTRVLPQVQDMFPAWRTSDEIMYSIPERYRHLKKLWTSPYMSIMVTSWSGDAITLRPESWHDENARIHERVNFMPPNQRVQLAPAKYNAPAGKSVADREAIYGPLEDYGDSWNTAINIGGFPQVALVNDQAILYMANNARGLAQSRNAADWSQTKALQGNALSFDAANSSMRLSSDVYNAGQVADQASTALNQRQAIHQGINAALGNVGSGAMGGAVAGPAGAAAGAAMAAAGSAAGALSIASNHSAMGEAQGIRAANARAVQDASTGHAEFMRDSNKAVSDYQARGDYANTIAAQNAAVADAQMTPPSMGTNFGGELLNFVNGSMEFNIRWKIIDEGAMARIGEYWLRYGYAVQRWIKSLPADLHAMSKFTYWKTMETHIVTSNAPEGAKGIVRGVIEKGVTVWVRPEYIGKTDWADNAPLEGIRL